METYKVSIEASYMFTKSIQKEYFDWLGDYRDTDKMRKAFIRDRFIHPDFFSHYLREMPFLLDVDKAKVKVENGKK